MQNNNDKLIKDFIKHLQEGKPIQRRKQKPVSQKTADKYYSYLTNVLSKHLGDFTQLDEKKIASFRKKLKDNKIKSLIGKPYADSVKRDIEYKLLGKFLKWMDKPELVYYTDDYKQVNEIPALLRAEVEKMISTAKLRDKVVVALLFDSGARADEFLNLQWSDLKDDERKAKGFYKIRIRISKTKPRTIGLYLEGTTEILDQWIAANDDKIGTSQPLVPIAYRHLNLLLKRLGEQALKKHVHPHLLRHSSATHYCHQLNQYQLCKRYGWSMASDMPKRYIDREGVDESEAAQKIMDESVIGYKKKVNQQEEQLRMIEAENKTLHEQMAELRQALSGITDHRDNLQADAADLKQQLLAEIRQEILKNPKISKKLALN